MLTILQLGTDRLPDEGLRLGTVRRPPRGVRKERYAPDNWFDLWLPQLAPSQDLIDTFRASNGTEQAWTRFERAFQKELAAPDTRRWLELLALLSHTTNFSIGCYCEDESRCHRGILRAIFSELGANGRKAK